MGNKSQAVSELLKEYETFSNAVEGIFSGCLKTYKYRDLNHFTLEDILEEMNYQYYEKRSNDYLISSNDCGIMKINDVKNIEEEGDLIKMKNMNNEIVLIAKKEQIKCLIKFEEIND